MNGFKRTSRRQAAVVGLAVLMGVSFLGCHSGPRLFSKKDRAHQADKQELAEKDKGKFINRKKVRPESEYRRAEGDDERVAKSEPKTKAQSKPSDSIRKPSNDNSRVVAARKPVEDKPAASAPPSKTAKPSEQPQIARRDTSKRPVTDLLNDSLFDEKLPEPRTTASAPTAKKPSAKPATTSKTLPVDEDPFKNSVIGSATPKRPNDKVATVNFDDEDLDIDLDEMKEEAEEIAEAKARQKSVASAKATAPSLDRRTTQPASSGQRKFLDEKVDEQPAESVTINEQTSAPPQVEEKAHSGQPNVKRSADAAKTVAGQPVIDRRHSVQQTINDWRREMEQDESAESQPATTASAPRTPTRPDSSSFAKGHLSPVSLDEFAPPSKSQGAVLNGELIIDTNNLPSRFQRNASGTNGANGRSNANSGTTIEITPGASQNLARPAGQISLQALSNDETSSVTTADYEQPSGSTDDLGTLPSLKVNSDAETGPRLASMDVDSGIAPLPPDMGELAPAIGASETPSSARGWKRTLLVLSAMISAIAIGFALRRRSEMTAAPIQASKLPPTASSDPVDPAQWPRG